MSDTKNASLHCGSLNIYNSKGRKSYSFPDVGADKNNVLETDGKGNLRWVDRVMNLNGLSDVVQSNRTVEVVTEQKNYIPTSWGLVGTVTGLTRDDDITQNFVIHTPGSEATIKITLDDWKYSSHAIVNAGKDYLVGDHLNLQVGYMNDLIFKVTAVDTNGGITELIKFLGGTEPYGGSDGEFTFYDINRTEEGRDAYSAGLSYHLLLQIH